MEESGICGGETTTARTTNIMAGLDNSPTVQDTANSYGCLSGVNPEGKKQYRIEGYDRREVKKNAMKPIPLMICESKKSKQKTTQPKI